MREGNRLRAGLIAGTLALLPLTVAGAGTGSNLCAAPGGSPVVVNPGQTGSASGQSIPIAFNSQDGEFLVTWDINSDGGQRGVYAQRVAADGSLIGDNSAILAGPEPEIFFTPAVAYSPADNHYFVASQFQGGPPGTPDFNNGLGRLVTAAGEPAGDIVRLSPAGLEGTLVFNPVTEEFLHHGRNFDGGGDPGIYFRRIGSDGAPLGEPTPIATTGNPAPAGDVEVNATSGEYLSTWRDQNAGALKGQLLDGDGAPLGEPFVISDVFPPFGFASSVAYDPIDDQYLVVLSGFTNPSPLFGQFVDASGELIGSPLTLVDGDIQLPRIAYDPMHQVYLITWVEDGGIWVQLLSRQGEELGETQQLTSSLGFATSGWAAANENGGGFLVSWLQADGTHVAVRLVDVIDECGVTVDPKTVDFGDQEVGTTSPPQTVMVENAGSTDLDLGTLMLAGDDPGDYAIVDDTCSEQLLTPGATCTFDVTFTPAAAFIRLARVDIPTDAPVSPNTVDLRGNGLGAVAMVTPQAVDFGQVEVGQTSPPAAVTVENTGNAGLEIGDLTLAGEDSDAFSLVNDGCSEQTVPGGGSCTFEVAFTPSALGTHTAAMDIPSNAPSSPDLVDLQGEGVPTSPDIQADPASLSSTLLEGGTETHDLTISNLGDMTLEWEVTEAGGLTGGMPLAGGPRPRVSPVRVPAAPAPWRSVADVAGSEARREGEVWSWTDPGMTVGDPAGAVSNVFPSVGSLTFYEARGDFQAANPGLPLEDFGDTNAPPNEVTSCSPPFNSDTDNACFSPGDIAPGLSMDVTIVDGEAGGDAVVLTPPFAGVPCVSVGPEQFLDHADWDFDPRVRAAGFDLQSNEAGQVFTVTVFGPGGALGSADVTTAGPGSPVFFGVDTSDTQGISRIEVRGPDQSGELFCDVEFGGEPIDCALPAWVSVDPTSGSVTGGDSQLVGVTFDATGLAPGDYAANLCLASNDPDTPTQPVPLSLTVEVEGEGPIAEITPESFAFEVPVGGSDTQALNVGNVGDADLDWEIEESEAGGSAGARTGVPYAYGLAVMPELHAPVGFDRASGIPAGLRGRALARGPGGNVAAGSARSDEPADPVVLPAPQPAAVEELAEGFDDITLLPGAGWALINNSEPLGPLSWFQGNPTIFESHVGDADAYIAVNYESTDGSGDISNWLITPEVTIVNGTELRFWTRTTEQFEEFFDRLEVRLSVEGDSVDVGETVESVGDFTELLLTINPELEPDEYPEEWTEYVLTVRGRSRKPVTGRFAFRYWVTDSGPMGENGDYIGIDTVSVSQPGGGGGGCANPADVPWLSFTPAAGTTPPDDSVPVSVTVNATGLEQGEHTAQLCVTTNDPNAPLVEIPVHLLVTSAARVLFNGSPW